MSTDDRAREACERWRSTSLEVRLGDVERCRKNGWTVGTHLTGDEGWGPTVIEITAIGQEGILARPLSHDGKPSDSPGGVVDAVLPRLAARPRCCATRVREGKRMSEDEGQPGDLLERVARAIYEDTDRPEIGWLDLSQGHREEWRTEARAALREFAAWLGDQPEVSTADLHTWLCAEIEVDDD